MMRQILLLTILFASCGHNDKENKNKIDVALTFINAYVENCNKMKQSAGVVDWINSNELTTDGFKSEVKRIVDYAFELEPELGLDADPIFDAQDHPDKGFELDSLDESNNYVTVRGKEWPQFLVTIKLVKEHGKWLVDGCGMINIPNATRHE